MSGKFSANGSSTLTKAVLSETYDEKMIDRVINRIGGVQIEINNDKSMNTLVPGQPTQSGSWSDPEVDANKKTVTITTTTPNTARTKDVVIKVMEKDMQMRIAFVSSGVAIPIFKPADEEKDAGDDKKKESTNRNKNDTRKSK